MQQIKASELYKKINMYTIKSSSGNGQKWKTIFPFQKFLFTCSQNLPGLSKDTKGRQHTVVGHYFHYL